VNVRFGITTPKKYINLARDPYCPMCPRHHTFSLLFKDFPTGSCEIFFNLRMEFKGTRICFYVTFSFVEHYFSAFGVGTLGQKCIFRFRVKLKAVVPAEEWGESTGEGFSLYKGITLLSKPVLVGRHQFREETVS